MIEFNGLYLLHGACYDQNLLETHIVGNHIHVYVDDL